MEFSLSLGSAPQGRSISHWDAQVIARLPEVEFHKLRLILEDFGIRSAKAQGLSKPITDILRLRSSDQRVYLYLIQTVRSCTLLGGIKVGRKKLFIHRASGAVHELDPQCVLDFYVHESCQRTGLGKALFEHFLEAEDLQPHLVAYDRPSPKFLAFLRKHYGLSDYLPQNNNFVVFEAYFEHQQRQQQQQRIVPSQRWTGQQQQEHQHCIGQEQHQGGQKQGSGGSYHPYSGPTAHLSNQHGYSPFQQHQHQQQSQMSSRRTTCNEALTDSPHHRCQHQQGTGSISRHTSNSSSPYCSTPLARNLSQQLENVQLSQRSSQGYDSHYQPHQQHHTTARHSSSRGDGDLEGQLAADEDLICRTITSGSHHHHCYEQQQQQDRTPGSTGGSTGANQRRNSIEQRRDAAGFSMALNRASSGGVDGQQGRQVAMYGRRSSNNTAGYIGGGDFAHGSLSERQWPTGAAPHPPTEVCCSSSSGGRHGYATPGTGDWAGGGLEKPAAAGAKPRMGGDFESPGALYLGGGITRTRMEGGGRRSSMPNYVLQAPYATTEDKGQLQSSAGAAAGVGGRLPLARIGRRSVTAVGWLGSLGAGGSDHRQLQDSANLGYCTHRGFVRPRERQAYLLPTDAMAECLEGRVVPAVSPLKELYVVHSAAAAAAGKGGTCHVRDRQEAIGQDHELSGQQQDEVIGRWQPGFSDTERAAAAGGSRRSSAGVQGTADVSYDELVLGDVGSRIGREMLSSTVAMGGASAFASPGVGDMGSRAERGIRSSSGAKGEGACAAFPSPVVARRTTGLTGSGVASCLKPGDAAKGGAFASSSPGLGDMGSRAEKGLRASTTVSNGGAYYAALPSPGVARRATGCTGSGVASCMKTFKLSNFQTLLCRKTQ